MKKKVRNNKINLMTMFMFIIKRLWLVVLCAEIGFAASYLHTTRTLPETYTASGTMYVNNGNPNLSEYQYTNSGDLSSAVQLIKTYMVVVKSDKVMSSIVERLSADYPDVTASYVASTLSMASVSETGVVAVSSRANNPQLAKDIVNIVMEVAPEEIIRVVGAGNIEIIDYATVPIIPDSKNAVHRGMLGAIAGAVLSLGILMILCLLNQKVTNSQELEDSYDLPVLTSVKRITLPNPAANSFLLKSTTPMEIKENYAKLRMNLFYTLVNKESNTIIVTSSISGEGKSTIAANLAISCSMGGKKVLLIDGDLRRASQKDIFEFNNHGKGLSEVLVGNSAYNDVIIKGVSPNMDVLPAGHLPPNPAELLGSKKMIDLISELEKQYDLVLIDMPPVNIVADPLALSTNVAGWRFIVRQDFSEHRDIRKALTAEEMTGMKGLGFGF